MTKRKLSPQAQYQGGTSDLKNNKGTLMKVQMQRVGDSETEDTQKSEINHREEPEVTSLTHNRNSNLAVTNTKSLNQNGYRQSLKEGQQQLQPYLAKQQMPPLPLLQVKQQQRAFESENQNQHTSRNIDSISKRFLMQKHSHNQDLTGVMMMSHTGSFTEGPKRQQSNLLTSKRQQADLKAKREGISRSGVLKSFEASTTYRGSLKYLKRVQEIEPVTKRSAMAFISPYNRETSQLYQSLHKYA